MTRYVCVLVDEFSCAVQGAEAPPSARDGVMVSRIVVLLVGNAHETATAHFCLGTSPS